MRLHGLVHGAVVLEKNDHLAPGRGGPAGARLIGRGVGRRRGPAEPEPGTRVYQRGSGHRYPTDRLCLNQHTLARNHLTPKLSFSRRTGALTQSLQPPFSSRHQDSPKASYSIQ